MLRFEGRALTCLRGARVVFTDLEFALPSGGALVLVGPNGSGKSSLLRLMAGLSKPFSGELLWDGGRVADDPEAHRARLRYVGHLDAVKPALTAAENLSGWAGLSGDAGTARDRALAALERMRIAHLAEVPGRYLSAGQKRRLNLARLALDPAPLWLLDEPTTALDRASVARFAETIARHREAGGMVVLSTHTDLDLESPQVLDVSDFGIDPDDAAEELA
ncbi:heme ABC exporter ATP-binding protein CcmA [Indioceanicola profundi]|uniref:heme ABC exporter ATP-binding protein CcmA n=1 Tax=Indioceanicola profundi TaxID=2220096 RepID=UPI000E6AE26F|nr:heme ABC exporter ATP-binding protein CcmA [Indioceanicola profundi]